MDLRPSLSRFGTRRTLQIGFGGLLILIVLSGIAQLVLLKSARDEDARARADYFDRLKALGTVRDAIFLSGTFARDYLLAPASRAGGNPREELKRHQERAKSALDNYPDYGDDSSRRLMADLKGEINVYWKVLDLMLVVAPREGRPGADQYFYQSLVNRRETMFGIANRVAEVAESERQRREDEIVRRDRRFWSSLLAIGVLTVLLALALAGATSSHVVRLEQEADTRLAETAAARKELGELSAKVVQAQEEERRAISRELHDEVGQSLSALIVEASNTAAGLPSDASDARGHLDSIRTIAQRCLAAVRNMALLLRPSMLDDFGLVPALEWQGREVFKRNGLRVQVEAEEEFDELPDEHRTCVYRIAQETLHNCTKHAHATTAKLTLRRSEGDVVLSVQDNGHGFEAGRTRGLGLLGMQERVARLGGRFHIESAPGQGTLVTVTLPLRPAVRQSAAEAAA